MTLRSLSRGAAIAALVLIIPASADAAQGPICAPLECATQGQTASVSFAAPPAAAKKSGRKARRGSLKVVISAGPGQRPRVLVRGPRGQRRLLTRTTIIRRARPGSWRIIADPIPGLDTVTFATKRVTKVRLRSGARGRVTVAYHQRVSSAARVAEPSAVRAVAVTPDGRKQVAIADPDGKLAKGAVLSTGVGPNTPHGMLLKVEDVQHNGGLATVTGSDAPITDIGPQADITVTPRLSLSEVEFQRAAGTKPKKGGKGFGKPYSCNAGVSADVEGDVDFDAGTKFSVEWGGWGDPFDIKALAKATFDQSGKFTVTISGKAECELDVELLPDDIEFTPIEFVVGPVPVVIVPKLNFLLHGKATAGGYVKTTITEKVHAGIGVKWDDGLKPIKEWKKEFDHTPLEPGYNASLKVSVGPKLIFDIYDFAGPYITAGVYGKLIVDSDKDPWWSLHAGLEAGVGIRLKVWKIKFDEGIPDLLQKDWVIAEAKGDPPPVVTTDSLSDGRMKESYSKSLSAYRGKKPYKWSVKKGALPDGLTLDPSSGKITGTPTTYGTSTFTVQAKDKKGETGTQELSLEVKAERIAQTETPVRKGVEGTAWGADFDVTGSIAPFTWTVSDGKLPTGVMLNGSTGELSGTATEQGDYSFEITVRGQDNQRAKRSVAVTIDAAPLIVAEQKLDDAQRQHSYAETIKASGGTKPWKWSITAGALPNGMTLNADTGKVSGYAPDYGTSTFTVLLTDARGRTASRELTLVVQPEPLLITNSGIPWVTGGQPYSTTLGLSGGAPPYSWAISEGTLPAGLTLDSATGVISGTTSAYGLHLIKLKLTDSWDHTYTRSYNVLVKGTPVSITTTSLPGGTGGAAYNTTLGLTGGVAPYTWELVSGLLPDGLSLDPSTGTISGTPTTTVATNASVTFKVTDSLGETASAGYSLSVAGAAPNDMVAVSCPSATFCMALDDDGGSYTYNGTTWSSKMAVGADARYLDCFSSTVCLASEQSGRAANWNGTSWTLQEGVPGTVGAVSCADATHCFAFSAAGVAYATLWDGSAWQTASPGGIIAGLGSVIYGSCPTSTFCMVGSMTKSSTWNGTSWTAAATSGSGTWYAGACTSSTKCLMTGASAGRYKTWNGTLWSSDQTFGALPDRPVVNYIDCAPTGTFCAVAGIKEGEADVSSVWTWDGTTWTDHGTPNTNGTIRDISCGSSFFCVAVDKLGKWTKFDGTTWSAPAVLGP